MTRPEGTTATGRAPRAGASADGPGRGRTHRFRFERVSLRARLVAIIVLLLAAGLGIAAFATTTVVSNYLTGKIDSQLRRGIAAIPSGAPGSESPTSGPSEYYVTMIGADGETLQVFAWPAAIDRYGTPRLPLHDPVPSTTSDPFTVGSTGGGSGSQWRVVATPLTSRATGEKEATLYLALPLADIQATTSFLSRTLALSAASIVLFGALLADILVRRTLRPLRQMESTAAAIAAGDLSRRVPSHPPTTEIGSLSGSLNAMLGQIERAFATREASEARMRQFVSDASHELRTPLATIRGYGELYRMGALDTPDKVDDTMGRIEDAATRMGTLVGDLLALARLDEGRPLRHDPVDLVALARDSAQDLHALDPTRDVDLVGLHSDVPPADLVVTGDEDRLRQVLANLIGNVARHTPAGTPVQIALGTDEDTTVLEVRDHGPGITKEQEGRIFERFYRADSSRNRSSGGSGLGMAIVSAIVGAHGGTTAVAPTPDGGLTVAVRLPEREYDGGSTAPTGGGRRPRSTPAAGPRDHSSSQDG